MVYKFDLPSKREVAYMTDVRLLAPDEVAERLQLSMFASMSYLRQGRLRGVKLDKHWRVREADLRDFIEVHLTHDRKA